MTAHLVRGDARMLPLATGSMQCVVTSPPYFGLRSYGGQASVWGGDPECPHSLEDGPALKPMTGGTGPTSGKQTSNKGSQFGNAWVEESRHIGGPQGATGQRATRTFTVCDNVSTATCTRCGAMRCELGSQPDPQSFVAHLVEVFREVKRVLRDDGVCFVNMGDSYAGSGKGPSGKNGIGDQGQRQGFTGVSSKTTLNHGRGVTPSQKSGQPIFGSAPRGDSRPKSLLLIPERLSLALAGFSTVPGAALVQMADELATAREAGDWLMVSAVESQLRVWAAMSAVFDGWIIRSRIAWIKAAPMPESVRDRPTSAWEHIWMLTKSAKYYWDAEAVREESSTPPGVYKPGQKLYSNPVNSPLRNMNGLGATTLGTGNPAGRNLWNYWLLSPDPYSGAHFATYPRELVRRCVAAATSEYGACTACGAAYRRLSERQFTPQPDVRDPAKLAKASNKGMASENGWGSTPRGTVSSTTTGWTPTCKCGPTAGVRPCVVLDPFSGSGTTVFVAASMGRVGIGVELSAEYVAQARYGRLGQDFLPLAPEALQVPAAPAHMAERPVGMFDELEVGT